MRTHLGGKSKRLVFVIAATFFAAPAAARAQAPKDEGQAIIGAIECRRCHTKPKAEDAKALAFVLLTEYAIWKTEDKHAQAYAVLQNERSKDIKAALGLDDLTKPEAGCVNCHGMHALKSGNVETFTPEDGVSCAGCHGPMTRKGLGEHTQPPWRKNTPQQKEAEGVWNLRDPATRAKICMSCHIGNAADGKVVTHEMFAAGHPPLPPFEIATFTKNLPQHWRDSKDVPFFKILRDVAAVGERDKALRQKRVETILTTYRQGGRPLRRNELEESLRLFPNSASAQTTLDLYPGAKGDATQMRLALVGNVVAFGETMRLVVDRAGGRPGASPRYIWPDVARQSPGALNLLPERAVERWPDVALAHSDCYACHHDLRSPGYRLSRGFGYRLPDGRLAALKPGRPPVRSWTLPLLGPTFTNLWPGAPQSELATLEAGLLRLKVSCNATPFGDPQEMVQSARPLAAWCDNVLRQPPQRIQVASLGRVLSELCDTGDAYYLDFEPARQLVSVLAVGMEELQGRGPANQRASDLLAGLEKDLNVRPYAARNDRRRLMTEMVEKLAAEKPGDSSDFLQAVDNPADPALPWKMMNNKYLASLESLDNEQLNDAMQKDIVKSLEDVTNRELESSLKKLADFDPQDFQKKIKELRKLLELPGSGQKE
jgi:hypothetical protein